MLNDSKRILLLAFSCAYLTGCMLATPIYEDVRGETTAQFTAYNPHGTGMFVHTFEEPDECRGRSLIAWMEKANTEKVIRIPANKVFVYRMTFTIRGTLAYCKVTVAFTPKENKKYLGTVTYDKESGRCESHLVEEISDSESIPVSDAYLKDSEGGGRWSESSSWCAKDAIDKYVQ